MYTGMHPAPSQRERVYGQIKARLLAGDFAFDARLGEVPLAKELEASRTPVREALLRLWSEGLVERHPDGGFRPVLPDATIIHDLYDVRVALEQYALTRPLRDGIPHDRDQLEQIHAEWSALAGDDHVADPEFVLLDESFHLGLAEASGNPALVEMLQGVNERIRIVRIQDFLTVERIVVTIDEHLGIVSALLDGTLDVAVDRFSVHLAESLAVVDERSTQACLRMMRAGRSPR
ncbi:MAG: GntR family transcriptional regulator [Acidimicrobiales bacterium]